MEDEHGQQCLVGLQQVELESADHMLHLLAQINRTTRATAQNETSSRSHAILQLSVCTTGAQPWSGAQLWCKLSLVDLAGSEWAAKAQSDDRNNRLDGAEINKSLLCLKVCCLLPRPHLQACPQTERISESCAGVHPCARLAQLARALPRIQADAGAPASHSSGAPFLSHRQGHRAALIHSGAQGLFCWQRKPDCHDRKYLACLRVV